MNTMNIFKDYVQIFSNSDISDLEDKSIADNLFSVKVTFMSSLANDEDRTSHQLCLGLLTMFNKLVLQKL